MNYTKGNGVTTKKKENNQKNTNCAAQCSIIKIILNTGVSNKGKLMRIDRIQSRENDTITNTN